METKGYDELMGDEAGGGGEVVSGREYEREVWGVEVWLGAESDRRDILAHQSLIASCA